MDVFDWIINPDFSFLTTAWEYFTGFMGWLWDNTIGGLLTRLNELNLFGGLQTAWETFSGSVSSIGGTMWDGLTTAVNWIYDKMVDLKNLILDILGSIGGTILDIGNWGYNAVTGLFDGGDDEGTVVSSSGGRGSITNNFNITIDVGGITDRTDKLALAREIAELIQTETSRVYGGSTSVSRY